MSNFEKAVRGLYVVVAFLAALALYVPGNESFVLAAVDQPMQTSEGGYILERQEHLETALGGMETRLNEMSDRLSLVQGIGTGSLSVLGILQLLGFIAKANSKEKDGA